MADIILNQVIEGTTLIPISREKGGMVRCVCTVCGMGYPHTDHIANMFYKESYLKENAQECRHCANLKKADSDGLLGCKNEVDILIIQEKQVESGNLSGIRHGSNYIDTDVQASLPLLPLQARLGDLVSLGYVGTWGMYGKYNKATKVALRCPTCNYTSLEPLSKATAGKKYSCPFCATRIKQVTREQALKTQTKREAKVKGIEKKVEKLKDVPFSKKTSFRDRLKNQGKFDKYLDTVQQLNLDCIIADVRKEGAGYITDMICKKCGSHVSISNTNRNKTKDCEGCKRKEKDLHYKGVYQRDYKNNVFNLLEIISQDGLSCDVKCTCCSKEQKGLDLYGVVNKQYYCDCPNSEVAVMCDDCSMVHYFKISDLVNGKVTDFACSCGKSIYGEEVYNEAQMFDSKVSLRKKIQASGGALGGKIPIITKNSLLKENQPLYAGNDGEYYYRCRCTQHNVDLILNNSEIENYEHEACWDERQHLLAKPSVDKLKL